MSAGRDLSELHGSKSLADIDIDMEAAEARVCALTVELGRKVLAKYEENKRLGLSDASARMGAMLQVARAEEVERKWIEHALDEALKRQRNREVHI